MKSLKLGTSPENEIVLDAAGVAPVHARARLDVEGYLWIDEVDSSHPVRVRRNGQWLRVRRCTVCAGDEIRLGDHAIDLPALTAALGTTARLRSSRLSAARHPAAARPAGSTTARIARDPVTGEIRELQDAPGAIEERKEHHS